MRRQPLSRRLGALALLAVSALGLSACEAIPGSGPVQDGLSDLNPGEQQLQFNPKAPLPGASREEIVLGFVDAASSPVDNYAVARQFLAPNYSDDWDPSQGVFTYSGGQVYTNSSDGGANGSTVGTLKLSGLATIDAGGTMLPQKPGAPVELRFELAQVNGEWRITSAPSGVILDRNTFDELWTARQVYFLTPDNRLVAETRWFLNRATQTTQIIHELLTGPSEQMSASLRTAIPSGTVLTTNSVPVGSNGVAHIDLSSEILDVDSATMELIKSQIAASLQSVSSVRSFEILADGLKLETGTIAVEPLIPIDPRSAVVVSNGVLGVLQTNGVKPLDALNQRVMQLEPNAVTMSQDQRSAAVRNGSGVHWVSESDVVQLDVRPGLLEPALDLYGYVWSYATSAPGSILVTKPGQSQELLTIPWMGGRTPVAVRVSNNGMRIAALFADGDWSVLVVGSIVRGADGHPTTIVESASPQLWVTGVPLDLDGIGEQSYAVLSRNGTSGRVTFATQGVFATDQGAVTEAQKLGGGGSRASVRVLSAGGHVYASQVPGWQLQADDVDVIAKFG